MNKEFVLILVFFGALAACGQIDSNARLSNQNPSSDMTEPAQTKPLKFLALGDSYTIGEKVAIGDRWPVLLVKELKNAGISIEMPQIVATTGWTTDELKKGIEEARLEEKYDLVSLLIGVNNQYRGYNIEDYKKEFQELLDIAIKYAANNPSKVFVISIPDYGVTPFGIKKDPEKIANEIDGYNKINKDLSRQASVHYFDITGISRQAKDDPELIASDGLHPSGKMYHQWVGHIFPGIKKMLD